LLPSTRRAILASKEAASVNYQQAKELYGLNEPGIRISSAEGERFGPEDWWDEKSQERLEDLLKATHRRLQRKSQAS
jgi:hypothetical protein